MADPPVAPAVEEALELTVDDPFEDVVPYVQLEHEFVGFETIALTRLDRMVKGALGDEIPRTAMLVMCHAEIARDAMAIDPHLAGLLPCTTVIHEDARTDTVHVYHLSVTKAIRDLGLAPADAGDAVAALVELTGAYVDEVWTNIRAHASVVDG